MIKKIIYYILQLKAFLVFGKRVYVHGCFKVGNSKNITIGDGCSINYGVYILGHCRVNIGDRVVLSARSMLIDSGLDFNMIDRPHIDAAITIEDDAWIGAGAIILPNVTIGKGSIIGAGSVVTKNVPSYVIYAGNPARYIRTIASS